MLLSKLAQNQTGSMIRRMYNEALKIDDKISFTVGEPDFITPRPIIESACAYWDKGLTHYTPNSGIKELRQSISAYHANDLNPDPDTQIIITCGATEALQLALFSVVDPGDEVILITPAWSNYFGQIGMCGGIPKIVSAREENDFIPNIEDIRQALSPRTKCIILNSPSNPTGAVMGSCFLSELAKELEDKNICIIADEVYSRLVYDNSFASITSFASLKEKIIYINSFSKMFAMTGWRLGYAIAEPEIILNMTKLHENGASCLPAPSQYAAVTALETCGQEIERMRSIYHARRDILCSGINEEIPGMTCKVPKGAFYVFANIKETGMQSLDFCMSLLKETGVVTVPGSGFGEAGEGFVRFTYATGEENIREGISRIKSFMQKR